MPMLEDIAVFQVLKAKLDYSAERQRLIAQNVANADTPNYTPSELAPFSFDKSLQQVMVLAPAGRSVIGGSPSMMSLGAGGGGGGGGPSGSGSVTLPLPGPGHILGAAGPYHANLKADSESRVDGNQVVLEDQMAKMTEARVDHEAAIAFYQQSLTLLRTATKPPGK
jgi:flagellar basal-body rod protein FlgB